MNEEEKKAIEKFVEKCNKFDESVEIKGISVGEEYRMLDTVCKALNLIEKLQKENEELLEVKVSASAHNRILELEKENEELEEINNELEAEKNEAIRRYNFETIPIKKVKDKIEEIDEKIKYEDNEKVIIWLHKQKKILQELLEKRK